MGEITAFTPEQRRICIRCERPVGRISAHRARPYRLELTEDKDETPRSVGPICLDERSCKAVVLGRRSERRTT